MPDLLTDHQHLTLLQRLSSQPMPITQIDESAPWASSCGQHAARLFCEFFVNPAVGAVDSNSQLWPNTRLLASNPRVSGPSLAALDFVARSLVECV